MRLPQARELSESGVSRNKSVEKHPVRRVLPYLETEQDDVLVKCVPPFREL